MLFWPAAGHRLIRIVDALLRSGSVLAGGRGKGHKVEQELRGKGKASRGDDASKALGAVVDRRRNGGTSGPRGPAHDSLPCGVWVQQIGS